jgi:hypothetical protein
MVPSSGSWQLSECHRLANQQKETLGRLGRSRAAKKQPGHPLGRSRHAKDKTFQQLALARFAQAATLPYAAKTLTQTTTAAFAASIAQLPKPMIATAFATLSHTRTSPEFSPV